MINADAMYANAMYAKALNVREKKIVDELKRIEEFLKIAAMAGNVSTTCRIYHRESIDRLEYDGYVVDLFNKIDRTYTITFYKP